jgi:hypothetical protein
MTTKTPIKRRYVATNERGYRIGQDHHKAVLTDIEVEALVRDRGPDDAPLMSYSQLAVRYGISKSGARDIIKGNRRGQSQRLVQKDGDGVKDAPKKVRVNLKVSLRARAILHRLGGGAWIDAIAERVDAKLRCARDKDPDQALARVLSELCVTK